MYILLLLQAIWAEGTSQRTTDRQEFKNAVFLFNFILHQLLTAASLSFAPTTAYIPRWWSIIILVFSSAAVLVVQDSLRNRVTYIKR